MSRSASPGPIDAQIRPLVIGHRGAPGYRPEHTASAYRLAFEQGVDAVEPDIVVSRDGVLLIRHENEISGTTDIAAHPEFTDRRTTKTVDGVRTTGWFAEDLDWAELARLRCRERLPQLRPLSARHDGAEPILRLADLLALIDAEARPVAAVIELKHVHFLGEQGHDLVELLLAELAACGWADRPGRLVIECFELAPLIRLREAGLAAEYVFLLESAGAPADELARLGRRAHDYEWYRGDSGLDALAGRVEGVSIAKRDLLSDPGIVERAARRGLGVYTWTLRPENRFLAREYRIGRDPAAWGDWRAEWSWILETGVDGVFVDHPDLWLSLVPRRD
ncbi:MAG: glycerophosphodiester phosphodiesterase family protein [Leucobacter sp.]